jgi:DNA-binding IclR family transcriptional regulator
MVEKQSITMDKQKAETPRMGIQVIARAAAILRALREDNSGLSLGQIAEQVRLPRSTVQRIVAALQNERLVISTNANAGIRLGPEIRALSDAAHYSVVDICHPTLKGLSQAVSETTDLSVLRGPGMIFLDQVLGNHRLRTVSSPGEVFPLTTTANGRAVLAALPLAKARDLVEAEWRRTGVAGDWKAFSQSLATTRHTGLAYDLDEHTSGISAIGAAFVGLAGEHCAISVPIPSTRFAAKRAAVESALRIAVAEVQRHLGMGESSKASRGAEG